MSGSILKEKYRYRTPKGTVGTTVQITVGGGKLSLKVKGQDSFALASAPQGTLAMRVALGATVEYCSAVPAKAPPEKYDSIERFAAVPNSPAPGVCPPLP